MEDSMDCLIDLNSSVPYTLNIPLVPLTPMEICKKNTSGFHMVEPSLVEDNNPFDMVVRQTEINEADKNDPFEIAFEAACGYHAESAELQVTSKQQTEAVSSQPADGPSVKPVVTPSPKPSEVPVNKALDKSIHKISVSLEEINLDDIQPPEFLVNSSFDLSYNDSININDTLDLSAMSDIKLSLGHTKCSPFMEEHYEVDDLLLGETATSLKRKSQVGDAPKRVLSPIELPAEPLSISGKSGSFEESPTKALCKLNSEESVKTLIESRIQKCIARALNDSREQFRRSMLFDNCDTSLVLSQVKPPKVNLRASLSVPQDLHLLHTEETCSKSEQPCGVNRPSTAKENLLEELTIPVLDQIVEAKRRSINKDDSTTFKPECSAVQTDVQPASAIPEEKISHYRDIVRAQLQQTEEDTGRRSSGVGTELKSKRHRRSLSCDVILPQKLPSKGSSPPKLPPLPLSSDTIRDLSLCSKYSHPKSKSPGTVTAKPISRTDVVPAYAQPKLVLKKKQSIAGNGPLTATETFKGMKKGPLKAVVPLKNMTRFTGSPRPSAQSQVRRGSSAGFRQGSLDSPNVQKSKLCPLAASTPSTIAVIDKSGAVRGFPVITALPPQRGISSGIPSPSRRLGSSSSMTSSTTAPSTKADTPTRRSSVSAYTRNVNPRVLIDKNNALTSPTMTPIRKTGIQTGVQFPPPKSNSLTSGKENVECP